MPSNYIWNCMLSIQRDASTDTWVWSLLFTFAYFHLAFTEKKRDYSASAYFGRILFFLTEVIISGNAKWLICHYTKTKPSLLFSFGCWLPLMSNPSHLASAHTNSKALSCTKTHHTHMHTLHEEEGPCSLATSCCNCCNRSTLVWLL